MESVSRCRAIGSARSVVLAAVAVPVVVFSTLLHAQAPAPAGVATPAVPQAERAPVRRVVLYKSGIGYFEHLARVQDDATIAIAFTSGQLDDVLKSLTVADLGGGRIVGVNYRSEDALGRRLAALGLPLGQQATRAELLTALRGAAVDVGAAGGARVRGRLLAVERITQPGPAGPAVQVEAVSIVTDAGAVRTVPLTAGVDVRVLDRALADDVGEYLTLVSSIRDRDVRTLAVSTTGTGARDLLVSYVSEVPVWKVSYRLVLPVAGGSPVLQGWAIVDNTIGEDWQDVQLSLVAGAPQSFIQQVSRPHYVRRPTVPVPGHVSTTPQTHQAGTTGRGQATDAFIAIPPSSGRGSGAGSGTGSGRGVPSINRTLDGVDISNLPLAQGSAAFRPGLDSVSEVQVAAAATDLGELFEYRLTEPITIRQNQSALVPIVNATVEAEAVSIWNPTRGRRQPLRGVWLTNSSGLTLDAGTFSVIEGDIFAGEGLVDPIKAGERRLLSYADDLGVTVDLGGEAPPTRTVRVSVVDGVLVQETRDRSRRTYTIRNVDDTPRTLVIEHPARAGWSVESRLSPEESTEDWHRYRLVVDPSAQAMLVIDDVRPVETTYQVASITEALLGVLVRDGAVEPALEAQLREVLTRKTALASIEAELSTRRGELDTIARDQERVRENMRVLKGTSEERALLQRYVRQLDEQETRLGAVRIEIAALEMKRTAAESELADFIRGIGSNLPILQSANRQSSLSASTGLVRTARRAGIHAANVETATSAAGTATNVTGSSADTP